MVGNNLFVSPQFVPQSYNFQRWYRWSQLEEQQEAAKAELNK
jgi:hypothetical protein